MSSRLSSTHSMAALTITWNIMASGTELKNNLEESIIMQIEKSWIRHFQVFDRFALYSHYGLRYISVFLQ